MHDPIFDTSIIPRKFLNFRSSAAIEVILISERYKGVQLFILEGFCLSDTYAQFGEYFNFRWAAIVGENIAFLPDRLKAGLEVSKGFENFKRHFVFIQIYPVLV